MFYQFGADRDEFLNDGLEAAPLGRMAHWGVGGQQGRLPHESQHVVGEHGERQDQVVGGELAGRQPLQVEVGFVFAVKLLVGAMVLIKFDHRLGRVADRQRRVPEGILQFG